MKRTFTRLSALLLVLLLTLPLALSAGAAEEEDASGITYLNDIDFENLEPGTPDLTELFTSTPTSGYEVKEEDGNKYVSMSLGTHDDAFIVRNPATSAENGKLVIEVSYRYTAQTGTATDAADQWICQLRPNWTNLLRMKSYNGDVYVASGGPDFRLPVGEWTHLTMVVDPATDTMDLYVNGAAQITGRALEEGRDITDLDVGQLIIAKAAHKNVPGNGATLDIDNIKFYYAPETVAVTVNGQTSNVEFGSNVNLAKEGFLLTRAEVTCNGISYVTSSTEIPAIGSMVIEASYRASDIEYLNYLDFEGVETGTPDLSAYFSETPTQGYEVKADADGNHYVSMPLRTYNDAFILRNPATDITKGKLVLEVSFRYSAQENADAGDWVSQFRPNWTALIRIKSSSGSVFLCDFLEAEPEVSLEPGVWNHLRMIVDPVTDTMDFYLNEELVVEDKPLGGESGKDIETLSANQVILAKVSTRNECDATLDIDNIAFYYDNSEPVTVQYTVIWNVNGNITTETYEAGETPVYPGEEPTREADDEYSYTFAGWSPTPAPLTGNVTYLVKWTQTPLENPDDPDDPDDPQPGGDETDDETEAVTTAPAGDDSQPGGSGTDAADEPEKGCASGLHGAAGLAAVCVLLALPLALCPRRRKE